MEYLKLIRYKNLIFVGVIQILIYWSVITPTLQTYGIYSQSPGWIVWCSILATILIAGGGYIINDYFDVKIDRINRADRLIVTRSIQKHEAMLYYQTVTALGVVLGIVVSIAMRSITLGLIYIVVPGMLWFYSASYKRQLIIGNIIVSIASALVPLMPLIIEAKSLNDIYGDLIHETPVLRNLYCIVCVFSFFAFIFILIREIVKDMEDEPGDREMECHTIPVVWGSLTAKIIVSVLTVVACVVLARIAALTEQYLPFTGSTTMRYAIFGIMLPSICMLSMLWFGGCRGYSNASIMLKFIMIIGLIYSLLYYYMLARQFGLTLFGVFKIA